MTDHTHTRMDDDLTDPRRIFRASVDTIDERTHRGLCPLARESARNADT